MTVRRIDIEAALDELISNEEGMRFQGLAVVLAKERWPDLIASERKKDLGLDAHAPGLLARDGKGKGLASSLTATLDKIKEDVQKIQRHAEDVRVLIFATPRRVTKQTAMGWADAVREAYGIELFILSREDIITDLMLPSNASICRNHLGIPVPVDPPVAELLEKAREAASEVVAAWLAHPRLSGRPKIALQATTLDQDGRDTGVVLDLAGLQAALLESRRIVLEAPAGRGKTTTLVQLAGRHGEQGQLAFLIDLPVWVTSRVDVLEFIARMPPFLSRGIHAEDLARVYGSMHCSFLLNGWNEVSESYSEEAVQVLADLERSFPAGGIIVATRTHHIRPPLPGAFRAKLLPLSRVQRTEYLRQALPTRADELCAQLDGDRVLDDLTRTPLLLAEVTAIFGSGGYIPKTKAGVLAAVMRLVEQADEHRVHLERVPLSSHSPEYLGELAFGMTREGAVSIAEAGARSIIQSVSVRLRAAGQIAALPEPAAILGTLCAHHVLERMEYPSVRFRFQHQQFQEFYAASLARRQLWALTSNDDADGNRRFAREYVNQPVWEEPLRMIAEEIGQLVGEPSGGADAAAAGRRLIELALAVDPVFAAELSRLCGAVVWREVRGLVGERLRSWYRVADEHHRRCALAGMLASGSEQFIDVLLPLLTSDDQQVRLGAYRAWGEFHVSSLGSDWRGVVAVWREEHRADFIGDVVRGRWMANIAEEFARTDPSPRVRAAALRVLEWVGASDTLGRILSALDEQGFEEILRDRVLNKVPVGLRPRALATYERLLQNMEDSLERLRIQLAVAEAGGEHVSERVKQELTRWSSGRVPDTAQGLLKSALELVRKTDPLWVSHWVAGRIVDGSLWADHWTTLVSSVPEALRRELLERIGGEDVGHIDTRQSVSVLAATADADLAGEVFSRLCSIRSDISNAGAGGDATRWAISRQLEELFRALPPSVAVSGMLSHLSREFDPVEYAVSIDLFGRIGAEDSDLRSQVHDDLRQRLRMYLKEGVPFALIQDDFSGELKAQLALALARVGDLGDMAVLHSLIRADIERLRRGRAARSRGERGPLAERAAMVWSNWHLRAVAWLDPRRAEEVLLEVLCEPEYEQDAATALVQLARTQSPEGRLGFKTPDYRVVWEARAGRRPSSFDEDRRHRYATAIKQRISMIMEDRSRSGDPNSFNGRLKALARTVAVLDGRESAEFVMEIMALPGQWDGWTGADALESLLFSGARLDANAALRVLNPTIDHIRTRTFHDQQAVYLLRQCLCLLPFLDPPSVGIARIREIVATTRFARYELRDVVTALGHSRCDDALGFLLELATAGGNGLQGITGEWIDAVAALDTPESRRVLLSFVDPDIGPLGVEQHFEHHERESLASRIIDIARAEATVRDRLYQLCAGEISSSIRVLLADVVARMGTPDALVAALGLIQDRANPPIPHELARGLESAFLFHRPYGDTGHVYTLEPQGANGIRRRLFEMALNDDNRRRSAWALLGRIESWRLEYGRPSGEPRHPAFDSGARWPPIEVAG